MNNRPPPEDDAVATKLDVSAEAMKFLRLMVAEYTDSGTHIVWSTTDAEKTSLLEALRTAGLLERHPDSSWSLTAAGLAAGRTIV